MPATTFASSLALLLAAVNGPHPSAGAAAAASPRRAMARTWRGATRLEDADSYVEYLKGTGFRFYRETPGNLGVVALRRRRAATAEFLLLTLWESEAAIRRFAGVPIDRAVFYPEDARFLVDRDEHVDHFEVVFQDGEFSR